MRFSPLTALRGARPCLSAGDALVFDYRVLHRGLENR
jgi:hypothetical protein